MASYGNYLHEKKRQRNAFEHHRGAKRRQDRNDYRNCQAEGREFSRNYGRGSGRGNKNYGNYQNKESHRDHQGGDAGFSKGHGSQDTRVVKSNQASTKVTQKNSPLVSHTTPINSNAPVKSFCQEPLAQNVSKIVAEQQVCEEAKPRPDLATDTCSSRHEEETASLGKRSLSELSEVRIFVKGKDIDPFLFSIKRLEESLEDLKGLDLPLPETKQSICDDNVTSEVISKLTPRLVKKRLLIYSL